MRVCSHTQTGRANEGQSHPSLSRPLLLTPALTLTPSLTHRLHLTLSPTDTDSFSHTHSHSHSLSLPHALSLQTPLSVRGHQPHLPTTRLRPECRVQQGEMQDSLLPEALTHHQVPALLGPG